MPIAALSWQAVMPMVLLTASRDPSVETPPGELTLHFAKAKVRSTVQLLVSRLRSRCSPSECHHGNRYCDSNSFGPPPCSLSPVVPKGASIKKERDPDLDIGMVSEALGRCFA